MSNVFWRGQNTGEGHNLFMKKLLSLIKAVSMAKLDYDHTNAE